jgi:hypothetical protein
MKMVYRTGGQDTWSHRESFSVNVLIAAAF